MMNEKALNPFLRVWIALLLAGTGALLGGCGAVGVLASKMPQYTEPQYFGLSGQSVGVMVWADRGARVDFPSIQLDLATTVQNRLRVSKDKNVKDTTWPVLPASIVRYQREHPAVELSPITETAPKLGVSRLIYIEVGSISTRSEASLQMYRGNALATLRVIEVNGGVAKVAYEEPNIRAIYPPRSPPDGVLNADDATIYRGTIAALAEQIANRFVRHESN